MLVTKQKQNQFGRKKTAEALLSWVVPLKRLEDLFAEKIEHIFYDSFPKRLAVHLLSNDDISDYSFSTGLKSKVLERYTLIVFDVYVGLKSQYWESHSFSGWGDP